MTWCQKGLDFPSFYLELIVIDALSGRFGTLADKVLAALHDDIERRLSRP